LGKGINTDEAAALGAVYQAANLGRGFKVKKFGIKDATLYPIKVRVSACAIIVATVHELRCLIIERTGDTLDKVLSY